MDYAVPRDRRHPRLMPHSFEIPRRKRLGVRQLAAAFRSQFFAIQIGNHKGASKLAYSKGFAFDKNYAALGGTPELPGLQRKLA
jgi:hypothetical protein